MRGYGEIGRHDRFRIYYRKIYRFESDYPHHFHWAMVNRLTHTALTRRWKVRLLLAQPFIGN